MESNLESSLRVSLYASEELRRSLNSSRLSSSTRLSPSLRDEAQDLHRSRSSGVSLWSSTISSNTWPRSPKSASISGSLRSLSRFRSSQMSVTPSCAVHTHGDRPAVCPFDGSKYRLKPLSASTSSHFLHSSLPANPASSMRRSPERFGGRSVPGIHDNSIHDHYEDYNYRTYPLNVGDDDLDEVMAELDEVFHGSAHRLNPKTDRILEQTSGLSKHSVSNVKNTQPNADLWYLNKSLSYNDEDDFSWTNEESFLDKTSSCHFVENSDSDNISCSYGNISISRSKFPSRFSLHSTGSQEVETSGETDNSKAMSNGRKFRMQIEAKYEKYRETCEYSLFNSKKVKG